MALFAGQAEVAVVELAVDRLAVVDALEAAYVGLEVSALAAVVHMVVHTVPEDGVVLVVEGVVVHMA